MNNSEPFTHPGQERLYHIFSVNIAATVSGNLDAIQPELAALQAAEARRGSAALQELASPMVVTPQPYRQSTAGSTGTSGSEGYMLPNGKPASAGSQDVASLRAQKGSSVGSLGSQSLDHAASLGKLHCMLLGGDMIPACCNLPNHGMQRSDIMEAKW